MTLQSIAQYGKDFQLKVLGSLLTDKRFILQVRDMLKEEYFDSDVHKWIISQIVQYFDKYNTTVTMEVLKIEMQKIENSVLKTAIKEELRHSYNASQDDLEYVQEEFTTFCKNQEMKQAILDSTDLLKAGDYDGIRDTIEKAMKAGLDKNIGHDYNKDVETRYRKDYRPTIPTGWDTLDKLLQGGWGPGDLGIIFGNPGGGKSWLMVAIGAYAAQMGYNVNYYTLELSEDYVGKRFDCYFTGYSIEEVNKYRKEVEEVVKNLKGSVLIKEYPPKAASINTIKAHIQKCKDTDHKPDLVIIDYADYLKPPSKSRYTEKKDEVDDVFIASKALAREEQVPVLTPSQVNRMGAKDNIIEGDKAAGSYDKLMISDFCMSLSRQKEDKVTNTGRIHIMKNRFGSDGMSYDINFNTENGHLSFKNEIDLEDNDNTPKFNLSSDKVKALLD